MTDTSERKCESVVEKKKQYKKCNCDQIATKLAEEPPDNQEKRKQFVDLVYFLYPSTMCNQIFY
jgi:hypothetical protein